jgi:hypothetical protein
MFKGSCELLSFLDFFELCFSMIIEKDSYYFDSIKNIMSIMKRKDLAYSKIEKTLTISVPQSLKHFTYKIFTVSAHDIKNSPEIDIISNVLIVCRAEIIKKNYIIYEIPENLSTESSADFAHYQIHYEGSAETYANGRFLNFALTQGVIDNKKVYFKRKPFNTEIFCEELLQKTNAFSEFYEEHQMVRDYYNFEQYFIEKHGDKKKITNSLVYNYARDWALQYQSVIPYTPALKGDENTKAIARMLINSPLYKTLH